MRIPQQCVVTASPGVHIRCIPAKDGSIIIQTRDGSINISFRHAGSPQSTETNQRNIWSLCEPSVIEHARSRFCFTFDSLDRENTGEDDIEEVEEVGTVNLEEDVIADDDENDENVEVRVAGDDDTAAMKKAKRKKQSMSEFEVKEQCQQIRTTIGNKWKAQDTKQNLNEWSAEEFQFLGCAHFDSSAAWSYRCLIDSEKKSHLYRNPLHKWNLAKSHQERKQSSNINFDFTSRQFMLRELEPALDNLSRKERKPIYTRFERYINQGEVLILMENRYPGLLITIARFITTKQYANSHLV